LQQHVRIFVAAIASSDYLGGADQNLKLSRVAVVSKEGHGEAREVAHDVALALQNRGISVTTFPNLHMKSTDHSSSLKDVGKKAQLIITVSGDGTILKLLRGLDTSTPYLCVNVGGRGILAEVKPDQVPGAIDRILDGDMFLERRCRIRTMIDKSQLPPALNEVFALRQTIAHTPMFTIDFDMGSVFSQRMDGLLLSTSTGSTGHSYSYGAPFVDGSLETLLVTPVGAINLFPKIVRNLNTPIRVMASYALHLIIDGQETFNLDASTYASFDKHQKDAVFVRFDQAGSFRQLRNLGFT
jgi:NAD+ kinase